MTKNVLTRRELAQMAVAGAAGTLLAPAPTQAQDATTGAPNEGEALAQAVALTVGYTLTATQTKEVAGALKDYPGAFAKARAFDIAHDVEPAWTPYTPPAPPRKGRNK